MRLLLLFFLFLALRSAVVAQQPRTYFEQLTTADGLPDNSVNVLLQDHLGFIWLGTGKGLVRYDGVNMTVFQNNPRNPYSLKSRTINCLYEDRRGDLWVGAGEACTALSARRSAFFSIHRQVEIRWLQIVVYNLFMRINRVVSGS